MQQRNLTIVDVETTGGSVRSGHVIEIGILRIERGEVVEKYESLINPGEKLSEFIVDLTGITDRKLKKAPYFEEVAEEVLPLFEDSTFVAHNCSFDYGFVKHEFEMLGYGFNMESLCTVRLSRALFPGHKRHNLSALIERFGFLCENRHRAFDDAQVLWDFLQMLEMKFEPDLLETAIRKTIKKVPPKLQQKQSIMAEVRTLEYIAEL